MVLLFRCFSPSSSSIKSGRWPSPLSSAFNNGLAYWNRGGLVVNKRFGCAPDFMSMSPREITPARPNDRRIGACCLPNKHWTLPVGRPTKASKRCSIHRILQAGRPRNTLTKSLFFNLPVPGIHILPSPPPQKKTIVVRVCRARWPRPTTPRASTAMPLSTRPGS